MKLIILVVLIVGVSALPFEIRDPTRDVALEQPEETFARSDTDNDEKLSFNQFLLTDLPYVQLKQDEFNNLDTDHDGFVTRKEYEQHYQKEKESAYDLKAEYFGQLYDQFDENMDLKLDIDETKNVLEKRFLLKPRENFGEIFQGFDKNHDGGLDLEEYIKFDHEFPFQELDPLDAVEPFPQKAEGLEFKKEKLPMMKSSS
ncbi:unnamed protein product [Bursaphelenchus okinawaensis]|uniref:EF-hand domain-containing protein n=1 Tax=Bursaphelenchus okinawaensis TaxID=465554 RepID=A0A811K7V6_9BILA|nr:unnamed protein product [Bursaphelenchus okinawaensis]CAG9093545.1 unnamed protein product [Bursaphelenchus okinawaensis]